MSWRTTRAAGRLPDRTRQVAVIDLGSNSWRLVVFTFVPGVWWKRTDELYETVRIGAGMGHTGALSDEAMARGLETLDVFSRFCSAHGLGPDAVHIVATSAIRDAANGRDFVAAAQKATGLSIEILSEREEARLGYVAAINTSTLVDGAVLELGGGSLQLIGVSGRRGGELRSLPLGAVRLTEELLPADRTARRKDLERVRERVRAGLEELPWLASRRGRLVGIGGAMRNLAAAAQHAAGQGDLGVQGYLLTAEALAALIKQLARTPPAQRGEIAGIKPGRADIILAGALAIEGVLAHGAFAGIEATEAGLREGVFFDRELLPGPEPLFDDVRASAVRNLAVQYEPDLPHAEHVAGLSLQMFDSLIEAGLFEPLPGERELLWAAALLHDVGMTISYDDHHKHSRYLIVSAELPGFDPRERALIAQISRYHRKGAPKLGEISPLARPGDEQLVARCSVLLRLAEHLERGRDQSVRRVRLHGNGEGVDLHLDAAGDLTLPRWSVERYGDGEAFERVFGRRLLIG
jgi:exopolyphosphatase/guanosine-5'-triphosphate,3'-diphosphate pyrophosphatase